MISDDEFVGRLADLQRGPWVVKGRHAARTLMPATDLSHLVTTDPAISADTLADALSTEDRKRESRLDELLHSGSTREYEPDANTLVTSLHYALTELTLLELAVATGYLPLHVVRARARTAVVHLLWPRAARQFVENHGYIAVKNLTNRLGVLWFEPVRMPELARDGSVQFAVLLDHYRSWLEDTLVQEWVAFPRHYLRSEEIEAFDAILTSGRIPRGTAHLRRIAAGFERSMTMLADLFAVLEHDDMAGMFGLVHLADLERLFSRPGLTVTPRTARSWIDVARYLSLAEEQTVEPYVPENARFVNVHVRQLDRLDTRIALIERGWQATARLVRPRQSISFEVVEETTAEGRSVVRDFIARLTPDDRAHAVAAMRFLLNTRASDPPPRMPPGLFAVVFGRAVIHFAVTYSQPDAVQITLLSGMLTPSAEPREAVPSTPPSPAIVQLAPRIGDATQAFAMTT
jgi:hypothetical protein